MRTLVRTTSGPCGSHNSRRRSGTCAASTVSPLLSECRRRLGWSVVPPSSPPRGGGHLSFFEPRETRNMVATDCAEPYLPRESLLDRGRPTRYNPERLSRHPFEKGGEPTSAEPQTGTVSSGYT